MTAFDLDPHMVDDPAFARRPAGGRRSVKATRSPSITPAGAAGSDWRAAGNLPYNVGTPLLVMLAKLERPPERIVAMVQKDVADRLLAEPGTAQYGSLTVAIGLTMQPRRALSVPPSAFFPRPGVVSSVVVLHRSCRAGSRGPGPRLVRTGRARRVRVPAEDAGELSLARARCAARTNRGGDRLPRLAPDVRGEDLDLRSFAALADTLAE